MLSIYQENVDCGDCPAAIRFGIDTLSRHVADMFDLSLEELRATGRSPLRVKARS